jgi:hypothetical protein
VKTGVAHDGRGGEEHDGRPAGTHGRRAVRCAQRVEKRHPPILEYVRDTCENRS